MTSHFAATRLVVRKHRGVTDTIEIMPPRLKPGTDLSPSQRETWLKALKLFGGWPDPSTADADVLLSLYDVTGRSLIDFVVAPGGSPGAVADLRLLVEPSNATRITVWGRFAMSQDPAFALANAFSTVPVLLRRALSPAPEPLAPTNPPGQAATPLGSGRANAQPSWLREAWQRWTRTREWRVGVGRVDDLAALLAGRPQLDPAWLRPRSWRKFWADPCPVDDQSGAVWIFAEEYDRWAGKGSIVALRVVDGEVRQRRIVLADAHHRAFPRILRADDGWIATTDTCETPSKIFTFDAPGQPWRALPGAALPPFLSDPDLTRDSNGWSVIGTNWLENENAVCESWTAESGPGWKWERRDELGFADPVVARGGGPADASVGVRLTQDCSASYGKRLVAVPHPRAPGQLPTARATTLPDVSRTVVRRGGGQHTLEWTQNQGGVAVDAWWERVDPLSRLWALRDQRHLQRCRAASRGAVLGEPLDWVDQ